MILDLLTNLLAAAIFIALGGYIMLFGRRALWATLAIAALAATANVLAVLVAGVDSGAALIGQQQWGLLGIAIVAAIAGFIIGRYRTPLAVALIGFAAGADVALWLYDIAHFVTVQVAQLPEQTAFYVGLIILVVGGLLGLWFIRRYRDEGLILITMLLGTRLVMSGLGFSETRTLTAVITLGLALLSVVWQYADYLRESKAGESLFNGQVTPEVPFPLDMDLIEE